MEEKYSNKHSKETCKKITDWLGGKGKNKKCSFCNEDEWVCTDHLVYSNRLPLHRGDIAPELLMVCVNCGNTMHFNAVIMGLCE